MSHSQKAAENNRAQVIASATKAAIKTRTTKAQRRAAQFDEMQRTIDTLQHEAYELLLENEELREYAHSLEEPRLHGVDPMDGQPEANAAHEEDKLSAHELHIQNCALKTAVVELEQKASTDAQNFGGAVASLNAEIGRLHAELRATRERAREELEHAQERAKADLQHLAERSRCDQEKLRRLLTSIGSLVEDIATP